MPVADNRWMVGSAAGPLSPAIMCKPSGGATRTSTSRPLTSRMGGERPESLARIPSRSATTPDSAPRGGGHCRWTRRSARLPASLGIVLQALLDRWLLEPSLLCNTLDEMLALVGLQSARRGDLGHVIHIFSAFERGLCLPEVVTKAVDGSPMGEGVYEQQPIVAAHDFRFATAVGDALDWVGHREPDEALGVVEEGTDRYGAKVIEFQVMIGR